MLRIVTILLLLAGTPILAAPLVMYDGQNLTGASGEITKTYTIYTTSGSDKIPNSLNDKVSSFVLAQGYMAVVADQADGMQPSKTYIASGAPLVVNTLPANLDNAISFIRVIPWKEALKKGICGGQDSDRAAVNHSWYYTWGKTVAPGQATTGPEYVPMSWGSWDTSAGAISDYLKMDQVTHLLSFNEPDGTGQANIPDPLVAVPLHAQLQKAGLRLGSPACQEEHATGGWLPDFMVEADAQGVRVDYINVHWYDFGGDPSSTPNSNPVDVANRLKVYLSNVYARHRKPIWITEFNANSIRSRAIQDGFLQEILPYLEDIGYVERYSYYQWDQGADKMSFLSPTTGQLSSTGQIYNNHQSTAAYVSGELPAQWQSADIGTANSGAAIYNGNFTISGSGTGLSGTSDGCHYVYQPMTGDVTIIAQVTSQIRRNALTMSGVMIRESLDANSTQATMALSGDQGAKFRTRATTGGIVGEPGTSNVPKCPYWVKLIRRGDIFTGYHSSDGQTWTQLGSPTTIAMGSEVQIGLVATSNNDGSFNDAIFKNVTVYQNQEIQVSTPSVSVPEGGTSTFAVRLNTLPVSNVAVNVTRASGDANLSVSNGAALTFTPANGTAWQWVTLAAAEDADHTNGSASFLCADPGAAFNSVNVTATEADNDNTPPVVDAGSTQEVIAGNAVASTPEPEIFLNAALDDGANSIWEDSMDVYNLNLSTSPAVTRVSNPVSAWPGITAAYDFPGGTSGAGGASGSSFRSLLWSLEPVTLELWFKPDAITNDGVTNGQILWETAQSPGCGIFYNDGKIEVGFYSTEVISDIDVSSLAGEFIQVVLTYDVGATNAVRLYINGVLAANTTFSNSKNEWSGGDGSAIGARGGTHVGGRGNDDAGTESFEGQIAMFRGYKNQVLTAAEVAANFDSVAGAGVTVNLDGTVSDPNGDPVSLTWSLASGPGPVVFGNAHAEDTTVIMRAPGTYVLRLTADDGVGSTSQTVTVNVIELPASYLTWSAGPFANSFTLTHPTANPDGDGFINLQEFAFGTDPTLSTNGPITYTPDGDVTNPGSPVAGNLAGGGGLDFHAIFGRRKDYLAAGLAYTVQFSADLDVWVDSTDTPTVLTGENSAVKIEAVSVPFPDLIDVPTGLKKPSFFRVGVSSN